MFRRHSYGRSAMRGFRKAFVKILDRTIDLAANLRTVDERWPPEEVRTNWSKIVRTAFAAIRKGICDQGLNFKIIRVFVCDFTAIFLMFTLVKNTLRNQRFSSNCSSEFGLTWLLS